MNELNSVILEGTIKEIRTAKDLIGREVTSYVIESKRYNKVGDSIVPEFSNISVDGYGLMGDLMKKDGKIGRGLRVVGRLKEDRWNDSDNKNYSRIVVIAEHIEFKLFIEKTEEKNS